MKNLIKPNTKLKKTQLLVSLGLTTRDANSIANSEEEWFRYSSF